MDKRQDKALEAKQEEAAGKGAEHGMSEDELDAIGAGDQGMMFGYATNETDEYMPYPICLAHKLTRQLAKVRKDGTLPYLRPDGKSQVTVEYDENDRPVRLEAVVLSTQHDPDVTDVYTRQGMFIRTAQIFIGRRSESESGIAGSAGQNREPFGEIPAAAE